MRYGCRECDLVSESPTCSECGEPAAPVVLASAVCRMCHGGGRILHPFIPSWECTVCRGSGAVLVYTEASETGE